MELKLTRDASKSVMDQENIDGSNKQLYVTQTEIVIKDETAGGTAAGAPVSLEHKYHLMKKKLKKQKEISDGYQEELDSLKS